MISRSAGNQLQMQVKLMRCWLLPFTFLFFGLCAFFVLVFVLYCLTCPNKWDSYGDIENKCTYVCQVDDIRMCFRIFQLICRNFPDNNLFVRDLFNEKQMEGYSTNILNNLTAY
jgi:hypothetical protein